MTAKIFNYLPLEAKQIREQVFIKEQGFKSEYDKKDDIATHIVIYDGDEAIATCRLFEIDTNGTYIVGRLAVKKELRGKGIGKILIDEAQKLVLQNGGNCIIVHAQVRAKEFYNKVGFVEYGKTDYEQGCPHLWMKKCIDTKTN